MSGPGRARSAACGERRTTPISPSRNASGSAPRHEQPARRRPLAEEGGDRGPLGREHEARRQRDARPAPRRALRPPSPRPRRGARRTRRSSGVPSPSGGRRTSSTAAVVRRTTSSMSSLRIAPVDITRPSATSGEEAARRSIAPSISTCSAPWASIASATRRASAAAEGPATSIVPAPFRRAIRTSPSGVRIAVRSSSSCGNAAGAQQPVGGRHQCSGVEPHGRLLDPEVDHVVLLAVAPDRRDPDRPSGLRELAQQSSRARRSCRCSWRARRAPGGEPGRSARRASRAAQPAVGTRSPDSRAASSRTMNVAR